MPHEIRKLELGHVVLGDEELGVPILVIIHHNPKTGAFMKRVYTLNTVDWELGAEAYTNLVGAVGTMKEAAARHILTKRVTRIIRSVVRSFVTFAVSSTLRAELDYHADRQQRDERGY